ncbi:MAG: PAS domain S-box protein, partial [Desulfobacteraceae bacterium]
GLENNEFCMWITAEPLNAEDAERQLKKKVKDLEDYIKKGQIEILDYSQWYTRSGRFDSERVLRAWVEKEQKALEKGFDGLRLTGNTFWLEKKDWENFKNYEAVINSVIGNYRMLAICTYCLDKCTASEIMDVVSNHQFAVIKREGKWEIIESAEHRETVEALRESEEKYRTLAESSLTGIFIQQDGRYVFVNDRFAEIHGYRPEDLVGKEYRALIHPDERERVVQIVSKRLEEKEVTRCYEMRRLKKDGETIWCEMMARRVGYLGKPAIMGNIVDITDRKNMEAQQLFAGKILERINQKGERLDIIRDVLRLIKQSTGFEAVGIRLREGDDFPYFTVNGFSDEFVKAENYLCARDESGKQVYDSQGNPLLECMCGNVLSGRTDPALPFFTEGGSFWTNSTTTLLASTSEQERQGRTRNHCNKAGYESVALIPLRSSDQVVGLLQLNDTRWGQFTPEMICFFEGIGASIGIALARIKAEEEAKNLAKFPSENPFPVLRIAKDGTILYSNNAGLALLSKWERQVGEAAPHDWCQLIGDVLYSNRNKIIEAKYGKRIISFVLAPVAKAGYVNVYGRDVTKQKKAEQALQKARDELEKKVRQRTAELSQTVDALQKEVRERTLAQQALQQSEARLRDAQRIAHIGNWDWDIVNNQLWWSDEIYRIFGLRPQEFDTTYEVFLSHVHPDDREFVKQSVNEALYERKPYNMDHRIVRPDGTERIVYEQAEVI